MNTKKLSIVIPLYNEEAFIGPTLLSILENKPAEIDLVEIVVVDDQSTDNSAKIVKSISSKYPEVKYIKKAIKTNVSGVRNFGVDNLQHPIHIMAFLDADIKVTKDWYDGVKNYLRDEYDDKYFVTGSSVECPNTRNYMHRYWFSDLQKRNKNYINSANMITNLKTMKLLGGFDEGLASGEDYDFCSRVKAANGNVIYDNRLRVVHEGFPSTLKAFIERELWHGKGDFFSARKFITSKTALYSVLFFIIEILLLFSLLASVKLSIVVLIVLAALIVGFVILKFKGLAINGILIKSFVAFIYLNSRALSLFVSANP